MIYICVLSYDCNGTGAQNWVLNSGSTTVQVAGTNYCLDAGSCKCSVSVMNPVLTNHPLPLAPADGTQMKIWSCIAGIPAQTWYYTGDNRISLENQGQFSQLVCTIPYD